MTKTPYEIAQEALPGWEVVKERKKVSRAKRAELVTPDLAELRRRYLGEAPAGGDGFAPASAMADEQAEYVVMARQGDDSGQRRVVVVSGGRAVAVQG